MDQPTPPPIPTPPTDEFLRVLLRKTAIAIPVVGPDSDEQRAENLETAHEIFTALNPKDAAEAQLAALAIAASQAAMDNFARAARPNVSNDAAARLRSNAMAAKRAYMQVLLYFRPQQKAAMRAKQPAKPTAAAAPEPIVATGRPNGNGQAAVRPPAPPQAATQPPPSPLPPATGAPARHSPATASP